LKKFVFHAEFIAWLVMPLYLAQAVIQATKLILMACVSKIALEASLEMRLQETAKIVTLTV
jgi:hypothetical protein